MLSYILASFAAILSALCYTEFSVDMPVAGGAFVYVTVTLGEFFGWYAPSAPHLQPARPSYTPASTPAGLSKLQSVTVRECGSALVANQ